ncbi:hypothetical protein WJX84_006402 [Apatococcus fuscideae]|uniref:Oxidoreductase FAD/NAD(P)-binding domain-containing protein n=1 Tax=Apatococcus fuscideae TaxID=2026836 RepID=A0AAW1SZ17_9CHLO
MIAGGTGITPMWQVAYHILSNPKDQTKVSLIFGNLSENDILIKEELDDLAKQYPEDFHVYYVVNEAGPGWTGGTGFISADTIKAHLPPPSEGTLTLRCGPPGMNKAMEAHLNGLGYTESMQYQF